MPYIGQSDGVLLALSKHPDKVVFNECKFKELLKNSLSLDKSTKIAIINRIEGFTQKQVEDTIEIFNGESQAFYSYEGSDDFNDLRDKRRKEWEEIEELYNK